MAFNLETNKYEGYIYKITNDVNDRIYIGKTFRTIHARWLQHKKDAKSLEKKMVIHYAMHKYGIDHFNIELVEKVEANSKEELGKILDKLEPYYISKFHSLTSENGYNVAKGGSGDSNTGKKVDQYSLKLEYIRTFDSISDASLSVCDDRTAVWECCNHLKETSHGYIWVYHGEKPKLPKYFQDDYKEQKRLKRLEKAGCLDEEIYQYNSFGELQEIYKDATVAADTLDVPTREIARCLTGEYLSIKNHVLRYKKDPFDKYPMSHYLIPITVYDMQGNKICDYESINAAAKDLDLNNVCVSSALANGYSYKKYLFTHYGEPLVIKEKQKRKGQKVYMCDDNWNVVRAFDSRKDVSDYFGVDCHKVLKRAIESGEKYRDYYWKQVDAVSAAA